ncbi:MAG TPA: hypothetical protein VKF39_04900, partial [Nitrososphaerales archaeon]|nr:hypothetical protein [Nitrososphaerales archaeon]
MLNIQGKWASRFIWAAIVQGVIATIVTLLITDPIQYARGLVTYGNFSSIPSYYSAAKVIASNGPGTEWLFVGYISYLVVGVIAVAVTALFYFYIEGVQGKVYSGLTNYLAWGHYVFMNVGVTASMLLMTYGGYMAGVYASENKTALIHPQVLGPITIPIGGFIL